MEKYSSVAIDLYGNAVAGATVTVYLTGTTTLATIYSDNISTVKANPFATGSDGSFQFYAANGRYDILLTKSGFTFNAAETSDVLLNDPTNSSSTPFAGHLFGLTLSNNISDAVNDLDIAIGEAVSDDAVLANRLFISFATAMTKQLDAIWAAGTNAGMRDTADNLTGAKWFHIYLFVRGGGSADIFASTSLTPTLPDSGTKKRRIGSIYWTGSTIQAFSQSGDLFHFTTPILDVNDTNPGTSRVLKTLTVPLGIVTEAIINLSISSTTAGINGGNIGEVLATDAAPSSSVSPLRNIVCSTTMQVHTNSHRIRTNTLSQIYYRLDASDGNTIVRAVTRGWNDFRGRLS